MPRVAMALLSRTADTCRMCGSLCQGNFYKLLCLPSGHRCPPPIPALTATHDVLSGDTAWGPHMEKRGRWGSQARGVGTAQRGCHLPQSPAGGRAMPGC